MSRWHERVEELLYSGETITERFDIDSSHLVITSHRILAFTPTLDGSSFHQADLPNVEGVGMGSTSDRSNLRRGLTLAVLGTALFAMGTIVDLDGLIGDTSSLDTDGADQIGGSGLIDLFQTILTVFSLLDDAMQLLGGFCIIAGLGLIAYFFQMERQPTIVIEIADEGKSIHIPRPDEAGRVIERLERVLQHGKVSAQRSGEKYYNDDDSGNSHGGQNDPVTPAGDDTADDPPTGFVADREAETDDSSSSQNLF